MTITEEKAKQIAFLSRIKIDDNKLQDIVSDLNNLLNLLEELNEVKTENITPLTSIAQITECYSCFPIREDKVVVENILDEILANAPEAQDGYFMVPKVVE